MKRAFALSLVVFAAGCGLPPGEAGDTERTIADTTTPQYACNMLPSNCFGCWPTRALDGFFPDDNWANEANPWIGAGQNGYIATSQYYGQYVVIAGYDVTRTKILWTKFIGNAQQTVAGSQSTDTLDAVIYFKRLPGSIVTHCPYNDEAGQVGFQPVNTGGGNNPFPTAYFCVNLQPIATGCGCADESLAQACDYNGAECGEVTDNCNARVSCGGCGAFAKCVDLQCESTKPPPPVKCNGVCI